MTRGFSLVEVVLALLLLQVGILATVGMILLSQENFRLAELTLRGVLEASWTADSLSQVGGGGSGVTPRVWGELLWEPMSVPIEGLRVSAVSPLEKDTLATVLALPPLNSSGLSWPDTLLPEEGP